MNSPKIQAQIRRNKLIERVEELERSLKRRDHKQRQAMKTKERAQSKELTAQKKMHMADDPTTTTRTTFQRDRLRIEADNLRHEAKNMNEEADRALMKLALKERELEAARAELV